MVGRHACPRGGFTDDAAALKCGQLVVEAQQFFAKVIEERRREPRDDIISDLVHTKVTDDQGTERHLDMHELQDLLDQLLTAATKPPPTPSAPR